MAQLLLDIGAIVDFITGNMSDVLGMFLNNVVLVLLLGLMVTGAIFSFGFRLLHRR